MTAIASSLTTLPFAQFKRNPAFYLAYDTVYLVGALAVVLGLPEIGYQPAVQELAWWQLALLPAAVYVMIMAHVFAHNASHGNFPRAINRVVGEFCGIMVLSKFASWEIVHRRHHRYSDDPERDPHPAERSYWRYVVHSVVNVEKQLQQQYFDVHGDTPETRRRERWRSRLSFTSGTVLLLAWYTVLGGPLFFVWWVPAFLFAALFVVFFNWAGHNAHRPDKPIEPANLDDGVFWWLNRMFFGIFFHKNHHRMAMLFNPMTMPERLRHAESAERSAERPDGSAVAAE